MSQSGRSMECMADSQVVRCSQGLVAKIHKGEESNVTVPSHFCEFPHMDPYGGFLKMGVPPNHSFSIINQPSLDTPILRNPHMKAMKHSLRSTKCGSQDVVVSQSTMFSGQCFNIRGFIWQGQLQKMYERWTGCALSEPQMAVNVLTTVPTRTLQSPSVYL